jgi:hypothetical protein
MTLSGWIQDTRQTVVVSPPPAADLHHAPVMEGRPPVKLEFIMQPQAQTFWCWAAVSTSMAHFYTPGSKLTQCAVATIAKKPNDCCADGKSEDCNDRHSLKHALEIVGHLRDHQGGTIDLVNQNGGPSLLDEIDAGRPVGAYIDIKVGHFVVLHGYHLTDDGESVDVADPSTDDPTYSTFDFKSFKAKGYHGGAWSHTYFTQG